MTTRSNLTGAGFGQIAVAVARDSYSYALGFDRLRKSTLLIPTLQP